LIRYISYQKFLRYPSLIDGNFKLRKKNTHELIKLFDKEQYDVIDAIRKHQIDKVVFPQEIYRILFSDSYQYAYTEQYEEGFSNLKQFHEYSENFSEREILQFFKNLLETLSKVHQDKIYSGDIWADNILVNQELDYRLIDFDLARCEEVLTQEVNIEDVLFLEQYNPKVLNSNYSLYEQIALSDKMQMLSMIIFYLKTGKFPEKRHFPTSETGRLELPQTIEQKLDAYLKGTIPPKKDEYFLNELDELICKNYQFPYRKQK